jgi:cell division septation protein DedD
MFREGGGPLVTCAAVLFRYRRDEAVKNPRALTGAVLLMAILAMAGCSRERIDWKSAESADTQEAYDHFLERHPDSELAAQARARLAQLAEDKDWKSATAADTADAYRQFLASHASGKWAEEARIRIENFSLDTNPSPVAAPSADTASSAPRSGTATPGERASVPPHEIQAAKETAAAARVPGPPSKPASVTTSDASSAAAKSAAAEKYAAAAKPPATAPGAKSITTGPPSKPVTTSSTETSSGYGIQLGAFSSQAAALSEWKRLQTAYDAELHGLFAHAVPVQVTSGTLFRLQSPVGEETRARDICGALTKHAQPCVVVLPAEKR